MIKENSLRNWGCLQDVHNLIKIMFTIIMRFLPAHGRDWRRKLKPNEDITIKKY